MYESFNYQVKKRPLLNLPKIQGCVISSQELTIYNLHPKHILRIIFLAFFHSYKSLMWGAEDVEA